MSRATILFLLVIFGCGQNPAEPQASGLGDDPPAAPPELPPDSPPKIEIQLDIIGKVVGLDGQPLASAEVHFWSCRLAYGDWGNMYFCSGPTTMTDSEGSFSYYDPWSTQCVEGETIPTEVVGVWEAVGDVYWIGFEPLLCTSETQSLEIHVCATSMSPAVGRLWTAALLTPAWCDIQPAD